MNNIYSAFHYNNQMMGNHSNNDGISEYEQRIIDSLYPDPSKLSYEEMLKLEEDMGKVCKGFTHNDLNVNNSHNILL